MEAFEDMLNNLKADMRERYVRQEEFKDFKQRVDENFNAKQAQIDTHSA